MEQQLIQTEELDDLYEMLSLAKTTYEAEHILYLIKMLEGEEDD
jgi:hypothetical protein